MDLLSSNLGNANKKERPIMRVLVIAPHADDETLGMGATIARRVEQGCLVTVAVVTGHGEKEHPLWAPEMWKTIREEARAAMDVLNVSDLRFAELPAALLDSHPSYKTNAVIEDLINDVGPDELFLPYQHDLHQDHTAIAYAALVATRPYLRGPAGPSRVLMYETPTETHLFPAPIAPPFVPNCWIDVSGTLEKKLKAWACYKSQHQRGNSPRADAALRALAAWRGSHIGAEAAEAFLVLQSVEGAGYEAVVDNGC